MIFNFTDYRSILRAEFERREKHNHSYSLRAYARDLETIPSRLSEILSHKQGLSPEKANVFAKKLGLNPLETDFFVALVEREHGRSKLSREAAKIRLKKFGHKDQKKISMEIFKLISNWEHLAILELVQLNGARSDIPWISKRLDLTITQAKDCIERLLHVGLLIEKNGKLKRVDDSIFVWPSQIPSAAIKNYHKGVITKSLNSLFTQSLEKREFSSIVMPIDSEKIPEAKKMIREFSFELNKFLTESKKKDRIYYYASQFFGVDQE
jgi:uncharacterized protein (TIGR02147 family)